MSQNDFDIGNQSGSSFRADVNSALQALASMSSGSSAPGTTYAYQYWVDTSASPALLKQRNGANSAWVTIGYVGSTSVAALFTNNTERLTIDNTGKVGINDTTPSYTLDVTGDINFTGELYKNGVSALSAGHGQCRLTKSGSNLLLSRFNGDKIMINGVSYSIPSGGVTLAPTGASANTTYYIYLYNNTGTLTLEFSATGYAIDTTYGIATKSGDATRTLVGMARTNGSSAWVDSASQRFVSSFFNRIPVSNNNSFTAARSTASTSIVEVNSEIRTEFLVWSGDTVKHHISGEVTNSTGSTQFVVGLAYDGTTAENGTIAGTVATATAPYPATVNPLSKSGLSEGYHYATLVALVNGGTATFNSTTNGRVTCISGTVMA